MTFPVRWDGPRQQAPTRKLGVTAKSRKARAAKDARYAAKIRQQVMERDAGECRVGQWRRAQRARHMCAGVLEWAHLGEKRRARTRGMAPEERHTTAGSCVLCTRHHDDYDEGRLQIIGDDANGELRFERP